MAENSKIEWTDNTFSPWVGCTKVSPACDHCYAEGWAKRTGHPELWQGERRRTTSSNWQGPIKWNKRAAAEGRRLRVFCSSLADVFDNHVPTGWRDDLWHRIEQTPNLDWLLLTKRPQNIAKMLPDPRTGTKPWGEGWPNVWLGTTVENQAEADRRIPHLLAVPAAKRFLSCEPLLGPLDLYNGDPDPRLGGHRATKTFLGDWWEHDDPRDAPSRHGVDWVIAGGESGPGARPPRIEWLRSLRDQCLAADVPFFFKQWGEWLPWSQFTGANIDDDAEQTRFTTREWNGEKWADVGHPMWCDTTDGNIDDEQCVGRVGKKAAGAMLDGREWKETPA